MKKAIPLFASSVILALFAACHRGSEGRLEAQKLEAEDLVRILGEAISLEVHKFAYSGGPIQCWLEIEETGQKTMGGTRFPGEGFLGGTSNAGNILLWWSKDSPNTTSGNLRLMVGSSSYTIEIPADGFMFGWKGYWRTGDSIASPITSPPNIENPIFSAEFVEREEIGKDTKNPRKISMVMKAKFPEKGGGQK